MITENPDLIGENRKLIPESLLFCDPDNYEGKSLLSFIVVRKHEDKKGKTVDLQTKFVIVSLILSVGIGVSAGILLSLYVYPQRDRPQVRTLGTPLTLQAWLCVLNTFVCLYISWIERTSVLLAIVLVLDLAILTITIPFVIARIKRGEKNR